jgi:hypothetical protein
MFWEHGIPSYEHEQAVSVVLRESAKQGHRPGRLSHGIETQVKSSNVFVLKGAGVAEIPTDLSVYAYCRYAPLDCTVSSCTPSEITHTHR